MDKKLYVGAPQMGDVGAFISKVEDIFKRNWYTNNGNCVRELEREIAKLLNIKYCVLVNNGTSALQIAIKAIGVNKGRVIVPAFTFPATAYAFLWMGYEVVLCDIDPYTHHIDCEELILILTRMREEQYPHNIVVVPVNVWGVPCDIYKLHTISNAFDVPIIYDSAHAFGNKYDSISIGSFGVCEIFSFHATKFFNTFEGGAITTNIEYIANKAMKLRNFGMGKLYRHDMVGINAKMTEVSAAIGLVNLDHIDEFKLICKSNYMLYKHLINKLDGVKIYEYQDDKDFNYQYIPIMVDNVAHIDDELNKVGILARRYFYPGLHNLPPFNTQYWPMPNTDEVCKKVLCLPTGIHIAPDDIRNVVSIIGDNL
jgi:dTDP-4-amino-4,6-dideoxygalactose transaminase